jgi:hypothetical protein
MLAWKPPLSGSVKAHRLKITSRLTGCCNHNSSLLCAGGVYYASALICVQLNWEDR